MQTPLRNLPLAGELSGPPVAAHPDQVQRLALLGVDVAELREWFTQRDLAPFRANQVLQWIYQRGARTFNEMTDLSKELRARLTEDAVIFAGRVAIQSNSQDGTQKLLIAWPDQRTVETVLIPEAPRFTACISSQVGCPVGCKFCASGIDGVQRDLTAAEIVEQALQARHLIPRGEEEPGKRPFSRLTNIVLMGMGEPLANYDEVIKAIRILNAPWGGGIGARKITLSTVGLPQQIRRLAGEDLQLNLALSLHAPDEALRRELIPWGKVPLDDLLGACAEYFDRTGREITLEYILLDGVNNLPRHAAALADIAGRLRCNINLLRYNPVPGLPYTRPSAEAAFDFQQRLRRRGVNAHVRTSRGSDIDAACGQLRRAASTG